MHFAISAGPADPLAVDWTRVARLLAETATPYVNVHLAARTQDFPGLAVETSAPADVRAVRDRMVRQVGAIVERFSPSRVAVENIPYRGASGAILRPAVEPEVIGTIVEATGCGFLLDLAHARLAAQALGVPVRRYVAALPVDRLRELHVTGLAPDAAGRVRDHMPLGEDDWTLLTWALEQVRGGRWPEPWALVFEYGGLGPVFAWRSEGAVLAAQAPALRALTVEYSP